MSSAEIVKRDEADKIERVLIGGDLATLKPEERVSYYRMVCESVGLNPLTKPFAYITLNGKLTLYALKDATDQLRSIHNISVVIAAREVMEDCFVVTAQASTPAGRTDSSIGAANIAGLKGEARCNAMMKAETKAKRRVTLSICGLGLLDETEVESIPQAKPPVERTTEDIPVTPLKPSATAEAVVRTAERIAPPLPPLADLLVTASTSAPEEDNNGLGAGVSSEGADYITSDDAKAIYMFCKKFASKSMKESTLRGLIHDFCKMKGLVDVKGDGTLLKVRKWYNVDGKQVSGITRTREALEHYLLDLLAKETEAK